MSVYRGYEPARRCTGGRTPGATALMAVFLGLYAPRGGTNLGIYQCATIPGSTAVSVHGEGRADDLGIPPDARGDPGWGWWLARRLADYSAEMGVQLVIYDRHVWSGRYPDAGWRVYNGQNPHEDHIHAELAWWAAEHFTPAHFAPYLDVFTPVGGWPAPATGKGKRMFVIDDRRGGGRAWWWSDGLHHRPIRDGDDLDWFRALAGRDDVVIETESDFQGRAGVRAS